MDKKSDKNNRELFDVNSDNIIVEEDNTEYHIVDDYNTDMNINDYEDFPADENEDNHL